jgi:hypothetical protein
LLSISENFVSISAGNLVMFIFSVGSGVTSTVGVGVVLVGALGVRRDAEVNMLAMRSSRTTAPNPINNLILGSLEIEIPKIRRCFSACSLSSGVCNGFKLSKS